MQRLRPLWQQRPDSPLATQAGTAVAFLAEALCTLARRYSSLPAETVEFPLQARMVDKALHIIATEVGTAQDPAAVDALRKRLFANGERGAQDLLVTLAATLNRRGLHAEAEEILSGAAQPWNHRLQEAAGNIHTLHVLKRRCRSVLTLLEVLTSADVFSPAALIVSRVRAAIQIIRDLLDGFMDHSRLEQLEMQGIGYAIGAARVEFADLVNR